MNALPQQFEAAIDRLTLVELFADTMALARKIEAAIDASTVEPEPKLRDLPANTLSPIRAAHAEAIERMRDGMRVTVAEAIARQHRERQELAASRPAETLPAVIEPGLPLYKLDSPSAARSRFPFANHRTLAEVDGLPGAVTLEQDGEKVVKALSAAPEIVGFDTGSGSDFAIESIIRDGRLVDFNVVYPGPRLGSQAPAGPQEKRDAGAHTTSRRPRKARLGSRECADLELTSPPSRPHCRQPAACSAKGVGHCRSCHGAAAAAGMRAKDSRRTVGTKPSPVAKAFELPESAPILPAPEPIHEVDQARTLTDRQIAYQRGKQAGLRTRTEALMNGARPTNQSDHALLRSIEARKADAERLGTVLGRARAFLQRKMPVYACDVAGGPKGMFQVGRREPMTGEQLIALAKSRGFEDAA